MGGERTPVVKQATAAGRLWRRRPRGLWQRQPRGRSRLWRRQRRVVGRWGVAVGAVSRCMKNGPLA